MDTPAPARTPAEFGSQLTWLRQPSVMLVVAVAVVSVLLAAACGGNGDDGDVGDDGASPQVTVADESQIGDGIEVSDSFDGSQQACVSLVNAFVSVVSGAGLPSPGEVDGGEFGGGIPSELADDFAVVESAYAPYAEVFEAQSQPGGFSDPEVIERLEELDDAIDTPEVQQSTERITDFIDDQCSDFGLGGFAP